MAGEFNYLTDVIEPGDPVDPGEWSTISNWNVPAIGELTQTGSDFFNEDNISQANAMFANLIPAWQAQQGAAQWGGEFAEASRRWQADFFQNQQNDQNTLALNREQQALADWTARTQAGFTQQGLDAQAVNDAAAIDLAQQAQDLAQQQWVTGSELSQSQLEEQQRAALVAEASALRRIALEEITQGRTLDLSERRMILDDENRKLEQDIQREQIGAGLEQARLAAYGRSQPMSSTVRSRWG